MSKMLTYLGVVMVGIAIVTLASADVWVPAGNALNEDPTQGIGIPPSMAVNVDTPYVVWAELDTVSSLRKIHVKHYNGTAWESDGVVDSNTYIEAPSIAIAGGVPYVAYGEASTGYAQLQVRRLSGGVWSAVGGVLNINTGTNALASSIDVVGSTPYVAWHEPSTTLKVYVKYFNGSSWAPRGGALNVNTAQSASNAKLKIYNSTPYVAWNENGKMIYVKHWNGAAWVQDGSGSLTMNTSQTASAPGLGISQGGTLDVVWAEAPSPWKVYVKRFQTGIWVQDGGTGSLNWDASKSVNQSLSVDIQVAGSIPYVAWSETNGVAYQIYIRRYTGSQWVFEGASLNQDPNKNASVPRLAVADNKVFVVWGEGTPVQGFVKSGFPPTPTPTRTITPTSTISPTGSPTLTITQTLTPSLTATITKTATPKFTQTPFLVGEDEVITYPSPARGNEMWFYYHSDTDVRVRIEVFNVTGEKCATLTNEHNGSGYFRTRWPLDQVAPGIYLYRVWMATAGNERLLSNTWRKIVVVKTK